MAHFLSPERTARGGSPGLSHWLGSKLLGAPLAMQVTAAQQIKAAIEARAFDADVSVSVGPSASKFVGTRDNASRYRVTDDGLAIVPIQGTLIDRGEFLGDLGGYMTSYEGLAEQFRRIAKDEAIKGVILDIDSPGGMVAGLFDLVAELEKLKAKKRVTAIAANMAASAAYAIGCAAHALYVTRSGLVGSIGVIALHQSFARALDSGGVDTTIVYAGDHKADRNPYQQLSHGARAEMSASVDEAYDQFVAHVAAARGIDEATVRGTEARIYAGDCGVTADLADGVKSFEEMLDEVRVSRSAPTTKSKAGVRPMKTNRGQGGDATDLQGAIAESLAALFGAAVEQAAAKPAASAAPALAAGDTVSRADAERMAVDAATAAVSAALDRAHAILGCEEAKGREALAVRLAFKSAMSLDDAKATLAAAAQTQAPAGGAASSFAQFSAAMAKPGASAGVKPDASAPAEGSVSAFASMPSLADQAKSMGGQVKKFGRNR